jgi:hypothetical protein
MLNHIFSLSKPTLDPSTGFLICEGIAARTGVQPYNRTEIPAEFLRDGVEWYFVHRDKAFIQSFNDKTSTGTVPIANEHKTINVTIAGDDDAVVGWISSSEVVETGGDNAYLKITATITDPEAITRVQNDAHVGLSMGYASVIRQLDELQTWVDTDGVIGEKALDYPYYLQSVTPSVNHLALCTIGRAGEITAVNLDSVGSEYINRDIDNSAASDEDAAPDGAEIIPTGDDYKLYKYPHEDKLTMDEDMKKALEDAIGAALADALPKAMCDAFKTKECADSLYGAFTALDLTSAIKSMYTKDKPADNAEDNSNQDKIKEVAFAKGFQNDSIDGQAVVEAIKVWREVGADLADSANEAMTATELKSVWLKGKGVELSDSMTPETINSLYATVRKLNMQSQDSAPKSAMKNLFDSFQAPVAPVQNHGLKVVQDSFGGAVYL